MSNEYTTIYKSNGRVSHVELKITNTKGESIVVLIDKKDEKRVAKRLWNFAFNKEIGYYYIKTGNPEPWHLTRYILGVTSRKHVVDCKDKDRLNLRRNNLRNVTRTKNSLNRRMPKWNTSGRMGVSLWYAPNGTPVWQATGKANGKKFARAFSSAKYGFDEARALACKAREEFEIKNDVLSEKGE